MNVPYKWLRDYVAVELTPKDLAHRMTMAGLEAEKIEETGAGWDKVFVGYVTNVERHPDADRLSLVDVEAGEHSLRVVTGAPNIAKDQKVALAIAGARLVDAYADEHKMKTLKPGVIRGVKSEGMVCSEKELGISEEHEGILVLPDDAPVGMPLAQYLGDSVIEFEITPNLVHAFSILGIAREAGAILDLPVKEPELAKLPAAQEVADLVAIDNDTLCPRYSGVIVDGITVGPSPDWLAQRLTNAGVRPISNIVDITNYVMLELGQPLHAFDLNDVPGGRIVVRESTPGERMETLDHVMRDLQEGTLLITDGEQPLALAGVMGGVDSEIHDHTTTILLESANFEMKRVRRTSRQQKLRTDASARYERGLDPDLCLLGSRRALALILALNPNATIRAWQDVYPNPVQRRTVTMPFAQIERLVGMEIPADDALAILARLGFEPTLSDGTLTVQVPTWRPDVTMAQDVIEEVARIHGYDQLPATLITGTTPLVERDPVFLLERSIRRILVGAGGYEARTYITVSDEEVDRWSSPASGGLLHVNSPEQRVRLRNPIQNERPILRPSIVPSLIEATAQNLKHERTVRLFEIGHVYLGTEPDSLPNEPSTLGIVFAGAREPFDRFHPRNDASDQLDYFDLKGTIDAVLARQQLPPLEWSRAEHQALHPGRSAVATLPTGERLAVIGEVRPDIAASYGIEGFRVVVAELDIQLLHSLRAAHVGGKVSVDHYLPVEQDFAIVVDADRPAAEVETALRYGAGPLVTGMTLFDVFAGPQLGENKKSLAYRVTFTAPDRALTDSELEKVRKKIEKTLKQQVEGVLRA